MTVSFIPPPPRGTTLTIGYPVRPSPMLRSKGTCLPSAILAVALAWAAGPAGAAECIDGAGPGCPVAAVTAEPSLAPGSAPVPETSTAPAPATGTEPAASAAASGKPARPPRPKPLVRTAVPADNPPKDVLAADMAPRKARTKPVRTPPAREAFPAIPPAIPASDLAPGASGEEMSGSPADLNGFRTDLEGLKPLEIKVEPRPGVPTTLPQAVLRAISDNALIRISEGQAADALASIGIARSVLYPQIQADVALGPSGTADWTAPRSPRSSSFSRKDTYGAARGDVSLAARQLLWDFGATRSNIDRSAALTESQNYSVLATIEDIAWKTSDAYMKVRQQRELVAVASENLQAIQEIAALVAANFANGNGTAPDVKRVNARIIEASSLKSDEQLALKLATDALRRLIHREPGFLHPPPALAGVIPAHDGLALEQADRSSPRMQAYRSSIRSREAEIASLRQGEKPRLSAVLSGSGKQYLAVNDKTQLDASAMLSLSYRITDGGLVSSQVEQVRARMLQDEMRLRDERETIESDLRQNYFTIKISRERMASLAEGVELNAKARVLYRQQFGGGRKSLLELLEVQQAWYQARRSQISNMYEERRATMLVLRSMGRLAATLAQLKG